ncbi:MAG: hypothetical protein HYZ50_26300 [Deltaproteobacteria bacterium]|nr:hypothetical protein [Deltaproteobacteria bacterium]
MDEKLGLGEEEQEQGRLREKLALLAVLVAYHQAPQVCQPLLGSERYASSLRRVARREAEGLTASGHRTRFRFSTSVMPSIIYGTPERSSTGRAPPL